MGPNPLAVLSAAERDSYRTRMVTLVFHAMYRGWQRDQPVTLEQVVDDVRDADPTAYLAEIHRAVARLERTGLVINLAADPDLWALAPHPVGGRVRATAAGCPRQGCMRPAGHPDGHLPDATDLRLNADLVIHDEDVTAAWSPGAPWVRIYADAVTLASGGAPLARILVPHTARFTPDVLVHLVSSWLNQDDNVPAVVTNGDAVATPSGYIVTPGTESGTLTVRHAEYFAVWHHDHGHVQFYRGVTDWGDCAEPDDIVEVPSDVPFTGVILDQICDDWFDRAIERRKGRQ